MGVLPSLAVRISQSVRIFQRVLAYRGRAPRGRQGIPRRSQGPGSLKVVLVCGTYPIIFFFATHGTSPPRTIFQSLRISGERTRSPCLLPLPYAATVCRRASEADELILRCSHSTLLARGIVELTKSNIRADKSSRNRNQSSLKVFTHIIFISPSCRLIIPQ